MFTKPNFRPDFLKKPNPQGGQPVPHAPTILRTNKHNDENSTKGKEKK